MLSIRWALVLLPLLVLPLAPAQTTDAEIVRLIDKLGDDDFDVRQATQKQLRELGASALPILRKAARDHADPDVRLRVNLVIVAIEKLRPTDVQRLVGHTQMVRSLTFSRDGRRALSGGMDGSVRLWDLQGTKQLAACTGHEKWVWSVALSPDGRFALSSGARDRTLRLWDVSTGKEVRRFAGHTGRVLGADFSPDGRFVLSGAGDGDGALRLFEADTGRLVCRLEGHAGWAWRVAFAPDGKRAVSAGLHDRTARLWDVSTGRELHCFRGHTGYVVGVGFAEGGKSVLTAGRDGSARLWDAETGKEVRRYMAAAECLAVTPDGKRFLVGENRLVRLLEVSRGKVLHRFEGHFDQVQAVAVAPDGRRALSGGTDGAVWLWGLPR